MATRKAITPQEVVEFNRLYAELGSYAEVARRTGRAASTVSRYIRMDKVPKATATAIRQKIAK